MSLEHIRKFLKDAGKGSPELSESFIDAAVTEAIEKTTTEVQEAESNRFKAEAKKIRIDIDKLKPFKAALEEAGYDGTVEIPDFIAGLKALKETGKKTDAEKTELERKFTALQTQMKTILESQKASDEEKAALRQERKKAVLLQRLTKDIGEKLVNGEDTVKLLIHEGKVDLDETGSEPVFKNGEIVVPYEKGLKDFLKARENSMKDKQVGGASSGPSSKSVPRSDMTPEEMLALPAKK